MLPSKESLCWLANGSILAQKAVALGRIFELQVREQGQ